MMEYLQELFLTACFAIVLSFIVAVSIAVSGGEQKIVDKKIVVEEMKSDKGLKVVGAKSKKRVKFVDDVVVKNVDHLGGVEESIKDIELSEKLSNKRGFLDKLLEEVVVEEKSDETEVIKEVDQLEGKVDKESKVMLYGEELLKECDDMMSEVHRADAEEKVSKDAGLLDKVLEREVLAKKSEDIKVDEFDGVDGKAEVAGRLEPLDVAFQIKTKEIDDESRLVSDDVAIDQRSAEVGDGASNCTEILLDEALDIVAVEEKSNNAEINLDDFRGGKEMMKSQGSGSKSGVQMVKDDLVIPRIEECGVLGFLENDKVGIGEGLGKGNEVEVVLKRDESIDGDEDDDWEGIERSELEKVFAEAVNYVEYGAKGKDDQLANLGSDVQMQLYGLHKLAIEGPCHEPQPIALKFSARAKWNAWQRLGSMSADVAMEHYIKLLSDIDPGWMQHSSADDGKQDNLETGVSGVPDAKLSFLKDIQNDTEGGRKLQLDTLIEGKYFSSGANFIKEDKEGESLINCLCSQTQGFSSEFN